jgi:hypothetical protein
MGIFWNFLLTNSARRLTVMGWGYPGAEGLTATPKILLWQSLVKAKFKRKNGQVSTFWHEVLDFPAGEKVGQNQQMLNIKIGPLNRF